MSDPAADVASLLADVRSAQVADPTLVPYCGPTALLERFQAGAVVTSADALTDVSLWTIRAIPAPQMRRLRWMLQR